MYSKAAAGAERASKQTPLIERAQKAIEPTEEEDVRTLGGHGALRIWRQRPQRRRPRYQPRRDGSIADNEQQGNIVTVTSVGGGSQEE